MKIETVNGITVITADEGKVFRRKGEDFLYGESISLGYSYYFNGKKLAVSHKDIPEDFEEVNKPENVGGIR